MRRRLTLLIGGARSGKSSYDEELTAGCGECVLYIATAQSGDRGMEARIHAHRQGRPATWQTVEAPLGVGRVMSQTPAADEIDVVLLDSLTLLISNVILTGLSEDQLDDLDVVD